ncbi:MAG: hypothetical protein CL674_04655 [Bdellovibrionaceae bacterium]|nr:hypothetical protein [Pseudobdellovibrionaceae bacterium]|tara:strand:- start:31617 stop:34079 length:2463 start_codon:yes stop_codon:yes gene_type:complete
MFKLLFIQSFMCLAFSFLLVNPLQAADESKCTKSASETSKKPKGFELPKEKFIDDKLLARAEVWTLQDLVSPEKNMMAESPFLGMNAAQRILAIVNNAGFIEKDLYGSGKTFVSNFFHTPSKWNGYKMVGGQEAGTSMFVSQLKRAVADDANVISFVGPHGSGKSAILSVITGGLKAATEFGGKKFAYYTFSWKNLDKIEALRSGLKKLDGKYVGTLENGLNENPLVLLPKNYQKAMLDGEVKEVVRDMVGTDPNPFLETSPLTEKIREEILAQELIEKGKELSAENIIAALNEYVDVKRVVLKDTAMLDAQGKDWNPDQLFIKQNIVKSMSLSTDNPMLYEYGIVARASGTALFLDEVLRNEKDLQNKWLTLFQDRYIQNGSSMKVPLDMLILTATNTANIREIKQDETGDAALDRYQNIPFNYDTKPNVIAQTLAYMKGGELFAEKIGEESTGELVRVFPNSSEKSESLLNKLWVSPEIGQKAVVPHGRYRLWIGNGKDRISIAPHVWELISDVVAASRMYTKVNEAKNAGLAGDVLKETVYTEPIQRIRYFNGDVTFGRGIHDELFSVTQKMGEGEAGIPTRQATRWINTALYIASKPGFNNTLDVTALRMALDQMANDNRDNIPANLYHQIVGYFDGLLKVVYIPKFRKDFESAVIADPAHEKRTYQTFLKMAKAMEAGESTYKDASNEVMPVNENFVRKVKKAFLTYEGEEFTLDFIASYALEGMITGERSAEEHPGLMAAVRHYLSSKITEDLNLLAGFKDLSKGELVANQDIATSWQRFQQVMMEKYGYNEKALQAVVERIYQEAADSSTDVE